MLAKKSILVYSVISVICQNKRSVKYENIIANFKLMDIQVITIADFSLM